MQQTFQVKRILIGVAVCLLLVSCGGGGGSGGETPPPIPPPVIEPPPPPPPPPPEPPPPPPLRVCLEWDWDYVGEVEHTGFVLHYGKVSEQYDEEVIIGSNERSVCLEDEAYFTEGMDYFFVVTATGDLDGLEMESDFSNEVVWSP